MNQQKRLIIVVVLGLALVVATQFLFRSPQKTLPPEKPPQTAPETPKTPAEEKEVELRSDFLHVVLTPKGAALKTLSILPKEGPQYGITLIDYRFAMPSLLLRDAQFPEIADAVWTLVEEETSETRASFLLELKGKGLKIKKAFDITPGDTNSSRYGVRLKVEIENTAQGETAAPQSLTLRLNGASDVALCDESAPNIEGRICSKKDNGFELTSKDIGTIFSQKFKENGEDVQGYEEANREISWVGVTNKYFVALLLPDEGTLRTADGILRPTVPQPLGGIPDIRKNSIEAELRWRTTIAAGKSEKMGFTLLTTTREKERLAEFSARGTLAVAEEGGIAYGGETPAGGATIEQLSFPLAEEKDVELHSDFLHVVLTTKGATLKTLSILPKEGPQFGITLIDYRFSRPSLLLRSEQRPEMESAVWTLDERSETRASFILQLKKSEITVITVKKTFDITPGETNSSRYGVRLTVEIENAAQGETPAPLSLTLSLNGAADVTLCDESAPTVEGRICSKKDNGFDLTSKDIRSIFSEKFQENGVDVQGYEEKNKEITWVGVTNKYFVALLMPAEGTLLTADGTLRPTVPESLGGIPDIRKNSIEAELRWRTTLTAGKPEKMEFTLLTTTREKQRLAEFASRGTLTVVEEGGIVAFIAVPIIFVLKTIAAVLPNYGVAIIILTLLIRLALFPLSKKQQVSAIKMQMVAPHLKKLKEKHKNDKKKQSEEMMKLYAKHGINPFMGCLPMLIQLPILAGLFTALRVAIDLRNAPFLYINDLSVADGASIGIKLNFSLPFGLATFYYLNPLPIFMVVIWVIQQQMMPRSADPQAKSQQRFMMLMPILFFVLLYNYAAGLALYLTFSTSFGIVEQIIAKRLVAAEIASGAIPAADKK